MAWGQATLALGSNWWRGLNLRRIDVVPALLQVAVWVGSVVYALSMVREARPGTPDDDTWWLWHLPMQAAFALLVAAAASLAARGVAARASMWWAVIAVAVVSAAWLGVLSLTYPDHLGSLGRRGGIAAAVWCGLFAISLPVSVLWHEKRAPATRP